MLKQRGDYLRTGKLSEQQGGPVLRSVLPTASVKAQMFLSNAPVAETRLGGAVLTEPRFKTKSVGSIPGWTSLSVRVLCWGPTSAAWQGVEEVQLDTATVEGRVWMLTRRSCPDWAPSLQDSLWSGKVTMAFEAGVPAGQRHSWEDMKVLRKLLRDSVKVRAELLHNALGVRTGTKGKN